MNMGKLSLSITTIGDLLLRQTITLTQDGGSIKNVALTVPVYQRPYKWTARNAIQLLDDIIEAKNLNKERYRVGTLILHKAKVDGKDVYNIVDGQQRTITFCLLLTALGEKSIEFLNQKIADNPYNNRNVANNYRALLRRVGRQSENDDTNIDWQREMQRLKDYTENQCELIVVTTTEVSEAFQFFDSQNARGKALYPHDLLKAYHLREMSDVNEQETERIVKEWEQLSQDELANFFGNYLYRIKEWVTGNRASELNAHNIYKFKGITRMSRTPFAQFYKSAYCYAEMVNSSAMPFVSGTRNVNVFQLNSPIIAGKPFFEYTKHYYSILKDIQNNNKYEGFYINDNLMVKTLDAFFKKGVGNNIARLLFDTSVLLYVDRFCPETYPTKEDMELFDQFVVYAFVWAYSLRAQYVNLGWKSAQNYILGTNGGNEVLNSFNIYRLITEQDTPVSLLSTLADLLTPLTKDVVYDRWAQACQYWDASKPTLKDCKNKDGVYTNYLYFFESNGYFNK